jgi:sterol desaturase/sphingolipid hydroxylase (fatty acid hydroxylase superfamily)
MGCFFAGNIIWTILEYTLHRFLFHVDHYLPEANWAMLLHFLLHGIHHYLPMDRLRLVMPPTLFLALETPFTKLAHLIFPKAAANGIIAGAFTFYILYDCMHYALHHTRLPQYMAEMKRYHLAHHYKSKLHRTLHRDKADKQTSSSALESPPRSGIMSSTLFYLSLPSLSTVTYAIIIIQV